MQPEALRVLLIEHDDAFVRAMTDMLAQAGEGLAKVETASTFSHGMARLRDEHFDVAILEFFLPDAAGPANTAIIKLQSPRVPVIVVGSANDEAVAMEAVHAGAQDYLVKSELSPHWLLRSIRYAVERNLADIALLDAEEKYRGIFDHLVEGIFQTTQDGHYLMANAALARIYGYTSPDELMRSVTDIGRKLYVQPGRREEFVRIMQERDTITDFESQIYRKDGSIIWISENCRAIRNPQGELLYYEGTVEDVTQRRDAEEKLNASEALYHSLVETIPQSIYRKDLQGRYTFANPQYCETLGKPLSEVLGKTIYDFFSPELAEKRTKDDQDVLENGGIYRAIEESKFPGGENTYIQVVKMPIFDAAGKIIGLQGMFWDITEQKMAEERIRRANTELARSREELRMKNLQMEDDLKMAREIQLTMLPQQYPALPRNAKSGENVFQFTHRYHPTGEVGGDFFSISALSDTTAAVFICDVAGHGVRSALVTAMIRALVEELRPLAGDPGEFLTKLNSDLCAILKHAGSPVLTTAFYLVANAATGVMRYANAGHPKPFHVHRNTGEVQPLKSAAKKSQPALGLFENASYQTSEVRLQPGDLVMLFTDGLYEVIDDNQVLYTEEMLAAGVRKRAQDPAAKLFDDLLGEIRGFAANHEFGDDVCLVGVELAAK